MTQRQIAALACKLLGLYAIINALNTLALHFATLSAALRQANSKSPILSFPDAGTAPDLTTIIVLSLLPGAFTLCIGIVLIAFADGVATLIATDTPAGNTAIDAHSLRAVAFAVTGIFILMQAVPVLVQLPFSFYAAGRSFVQIPNEYGPPMIAIALVKVSIGMWLLFGARGLMRLLPEIGRD